ncbi:PP2C family protein-serine/threonine phosphatase [Sphaerotilus sp.]|uniref:PP2C family protein-serine/threonine phosphatase n=1 Tax=Sphaerotilus sp. TaxID=2093942 RepID=UPI002ACD7113|nr:protein phosphatase 2C domain-containing protein [Sphaerotilus sp.]MDZ7856475.1 protein phosphatase 2C domain-containing protein [Sphaerotilus sp.]
MTPPPLLPLDVHTCVDAGARDHNEDDLRIGAGGELAWAVLSDGAGGHSRGDEASRRVVTTVDEAMRRAVAAGEGLSAARLGDAIEQAHARLNAEQANLQGRRRMHATVVALCLDRARSEVVWAHVGDSRLYRLRDGVAVALTRDDSLVQQMVDAGYLTAEAAQHHPRKNQLLCALGGAEPIEVHVAEAPLPVRAGDAFLLCSDGWWDVVTPEAIARTRRHALDAADWVHRMRSLILEANESNQDNYSAVVMIVG